MPKNHAREQWKYVVQKHTYKLVSSISSDSEQKCENISSADDLFDCESRNRVEEENDEDNSSHDQKKLDDQPLVIVPENVPHTLKGVHEPHERGVWTTEKYHLLRSV